MEEAAEEPGETANNADLGFWRQMFALLRGWEIRVTDPLGLICYLWNGWGLWPEMGKISVSQALMGYGSSEDLF